MKIYFPILLLPGLLVCGLMVQGCRRVKFVSRGVGEIAKDIVLFYGWRETEEGRGTAYLWDNRK